MTLSAPLLLLLLLLAVLLFTVIRRAHVFARPPCDITGDDAVLITEHAPGEQDWESTPCVDTLCGDSLGLAATKDRFLTGLYPYDTVLVARKAEGVAGFAFLLNRGRNDAKGVYIHLICAHKGLGVGRRLVERTKAYACALGKEYIWLHSEDEDSDAFYAYMGFVEKGNVRKGTRHFRLDLACE